VASAKTPHDGIPARYRWMDGLLLRSGAVRESSRDGIHTYVLGAELAAFLKRPRVLITFRRGGGDQDGVELAIPGSWFHDQILRFARERGRVAEGYLPGQDDLDRTALLRSRRRGFEKLLELQERRYGTLLVFTFRLSFYSEPAEEQLRHVTFDCERGRVIKRPIGKKLFEAQPAPENGLVEETARVDIKKGFAAAWESIQDDVETRVREIAEKGRPAYEKKVQIVEKYYRQLLAEEKRLLKTRATKRGQEESRGKIDLLKLEWERRVKEETLRLEPQVVANLSAVARIRVPLERWTCRLDGGSPPRDRDIWVDLARSEAWDAPGAGNGSR